MSLHEKQKRALFFAGITVAVYGFFRYLLPLVLPFFFAYLLARLIEPLAGLLHQRLRLSKGIAAAAAMAAVLGGVAALLWWLSCLLFSQISVLLERIPEYLQSLQQALQALCSWLETTFHLQEGCLFSWLATLMTQLQASYGEQGQTELFPLLRGIGEHAVPALTRIGELLAGVTIVILAAVFMFQEKERVIRWQKRSVFHEEFRLILDCLGRIGRAYGKSQGIIFLSTLVLCVTGLWLLGNPYCLLLGVLIAVLDFLPVFGTGTILVPWAVLELLFGHVQQALGLFVLYLLCYYLREILEARLMGNQMGLSALEMLMSMTVGFRLFGLAGLFYGPVGWILIRELDGGLRKRKIQVGSG